MTTTLEYVENEVLDKIEYTLETGRRPNATICLGPPGTGKTHTFKGIGDKYARRKGLKKSPFNWSRVIQLPLYPPEDLRGFITMRNSEEYDGQLISESSIPADVVPPLDAGPGIMIIDDFNVAVPAQQALLYRLIHEGKLGPHDMPEQTVIVLTGNGGGDKAVANRIPSTVINRCQYFDDVQPDPSHWLAWAGGAGIHPLITSFIHAMPHKLYEGPNDKRAWASPRSYELMSNQLGWLANRVGLKEAFSAERMATYIGEPTANELQVHTKYEHVFKLVKRIEDGKLKATDKEVTKLQGDEKYILCIATAQSPNIPTAKKFEWFLDWENDEDKDVACFGVIYTARTAEDGKKAAVPYGRRFLDVFGTELASSMQKMRLTAD